MVREAIWNVLQLYGVIGKSLEVLKCFHNESKNYVKVGNELSEWFAMRM